MTYYVINPPHCCAKTEDICKALAYATEIMDYSQSEYCIIIACVGSSESHYYPIRVMWRLNKRSYVTHTVCNARRNNNGSTFDVAYRYAIKIVQAKTGKPVEYKHWQYNDEIA